MDWIPQKTFIHSTLLRLPLISWRGKQKWLSGHCGRGQLCWLSIDSILQSWARVIFWSSCNRVMLFYRRLTSPGAVFSNTSRVIFLPLCHWHGGELLLTWMMRRVPSSDRYRYRHLYFANEYALMAVIDWHIGLPVVFVLQYGEDLGEHKLAGLTARALLQAHAPCTQFSVLPHFVEKKAST